MVKMSRFLVGVIVSMLCITSNLFEHCNSLPAFSSVPLRYLTMRRDAGHVFPTLPFQMAMSGNDVLLQQVRNSYLKPSVPAFVVARIEADNGKFHTSFCI